MWPVVVVVGGVLAMMAWAWRQSSAHVDRFLGEMRALDDWYTWCYVWDRKKCKAIGAVMDRMKDRFWAKEG